MIAGLHRKAAIDQPFQAYTPHIYACSPCATRPQAMCILTKPLKNLWFFPCLAIDCKKKAGGNLFMRQQTREKHRIPNGMWNFTAPCPIPAACTILHRPSSFIVKELKMMFSATDLEKCLKSRADTLSARSQPGVGFWPRNSGGG